MTIQIFLLLIIIGISLILFSFERLPADVIALGVLMALVLAKLLPVEEAFAGFGSDAVILILGLLILTAALVRTGVVDIAGRNIIRRTGENRGRLLGIILVAPAFMSTFMSNTASTAFFLPIVLGLSRRAKVSASYLLMPLAFATILASSVTLVATSTNIVVSGLLTQHAMKPIGMFELTPVGLPVLVVGLVYMYIIGRRILPAKSEADDGLTGFDQASYLTETVILPKSPLAGKTLQEAGLGRDLDLTVLRLVRAKKQYLAPQANLRLEAGDELLVEGARDEILRIKNKAGIDIKADARISDPGLQTNDVGIVEAILLLRSPLVGRTLRGLRFREKFGLQVLAINRHGETIRRKISRSTLQTGDVLLIQGNRANIAALEEDKSFRVIGSLDDKIPNLRRAPIAILAFLGSLALATLNIVPFSVATLLGVLVVFITRCITPEEAYREVEWKALILIGCMLGLGRSLEYTGAAEFLAMQIVKLTGHMQPVWLLSAFFFLTMLLTQPMSNQAAAVVIVPIALQTAMQLSLNPRTFAMMIAVGASCSFLTPLEPACLMVYGPGGYRFIDFLKVGFLLTILIYLVAILLVPIFWPF
jgi:di/tricarboxylate transporter